jgi:hypothetical protein
MASVQALLHVDNLKVRLHLMHESSMSGVYYVTTYTLILVIFCSEFATTSRVLPTELCGGRALQPVKTRRKQPRLHTRTLLYITVIVDRVELRPTLR